MRLRPLTRAAIALICAALTCVALSCKTPPPTDDAGTGPSVPAHPRLGAIGPAIAASATITQLWNGTGTRPEGGAALIGTSGMGAATIVVTGSMTATLQFEASNDSVNWWTASVFPVSGGAAVTSATAAGQWVWSPAGAQAFRVRCSAYTSGTPLVTIGASGAGSSATPTSAAAQLPATLGPQTPASSVSTVPAQSAAIVAWQFAAPSTARALLRPWANLIVVAALDAVSGGGFTCVSTTGGTGRAAGTPTWAAGAVTEGGGSALVYWCYSGVTCKGGLSVTNTDAANPAYLGDSAVAAVNNLAAVVPTPPNFGGAGGWPADPSLTVARAPAGNPVLAAVCSQ